MKTFAIAWVLCGIVNFGLLFAYYQGKYALIAEENRERDYRFCSYAALTGPIGLATTFITGQYGYGWKVK